MAGILDAVLGQHSAAAGLLPRQPGSAWKLFACDCDDDSLI